MKRVVYRRLSVAILFVVASTLVHAQEKGRWTAHFLPSKSVEVTLQNGEGRQGSRSQSLTLPLSRLQNLQAVPGSAVNTNLQFIWKTEAGTVDFSGVRNGNEGAGTYVFTADPRYRHSMEQVGFAVAPEQQLLYALNDVTTGYAKAMHGATEVTEAGRVLKMARLHISPEFAHKLSRAFGEKLEAEEVIEAARHKVTPEYVAVVHKLLPQAEFDDIAKLQRRNVSARFISAAQKCRAGVTAEEIARLKRTHDSPCAE